MIKAALNLPIQVISGYNNKGTADMRIAAESGEIDGTTWGWDSMRGTWQKAIDSGTVVIVLQTVPKAFNDLPKVPLAIELAKTAEAKQLIEINFTTRARSPRLSRCRPARRKRYRAQILQKALEETVKDREFVVRKRTKLKSGWHPGERRRG